MVKFWRSLVLLSVTAVLFWFGKDVAAQLSELPQSQTVGELEIVATFEGAMPTGVTVSQQGRIFVNFPRWGDDVPFTVGEVVGNGVVPYPDAEINSDNPQLQNYLVSVQSVVVDPDNRLWILDTGRPLFKPAAYGGAKLIGVDLESNSVFKTILFPKDVALPTTYLNDVRFDLTRGKEGMAFITDSSPEGTNGIIVVDLASGKSWRKLNKHPSTLAEPNFVPIVEGKPLLNRPADGEPSYMTIGADGIAIANDGSKLYYSVLSGRHLYSVSLDALANKNFGDKKVAATVEDLGAKGASDGLESDSQGRIYITDYEHNAIRRRSPQAMAGSDETLVYDPHVLWADTLSLATDGYLYFTANQLHRQPGFHNGKDLRRKPYSLFRIAVNAQPVLLK
ncbi:L-dopachrome tautomerase-related protein [Myxosarcina sp. GI1]|uniref:L-dopachrome tautomerase-related protein n=1 Tax=Myxosarcina sp. GI1 TaxID=1541065 RepID=UPI00055A3A78|nr:L-dopachrome tautomerase-related protein [Myxosarcina sp. GI1]